MSVNNANKNRCYADESDFLPDFSAGFHYYVILQNYKRNVQY